MSAMRMRTSGMKRAPSMPVRRMRAATQPSSEAAVGRRRVRGRAVEVADARYSRITGAQVETPAPTTVCPGADVIDVIAPVMPFT